MRKFNTRHLIILAFVGLVTVASSGCSYNTLQQKQQNVKAKWSNVEVQLQRRADLVPNLISAAQSAAVQEQQVFGQIAQARSQLLNAIKEPPQGENGDKSPEQKEQIIQANNNLGRLLALVENYPTLRSNENFKMLQVQLEGTENRIAVARQDYNTAVRDYNSTRGNFPTVISAKIFGFKEEPYFKADETANQAPRFSPNDIRPNNTSGR